MRWLKENIRIAEVYSPQSVLTADDSHYKIDRATYSLIIDPVNINDTSTRYECGLNVTIPMTDTQQMLHLYPPVLLSLKVISKYYA